MLKFIIKNVADKNNLTLNWHRTVSVGEAGVFRYFLKNGNFSSIRKHLKEMYSWKKNNFSE